MEYYFPLEKKEVLKLAATWINSEDIMLSEIKQSQKNKWFHLFESPRLDKFMKNK